MEFRRFATIAVFASALGVLASGCFTTVVRTDTLGVHELYTAPVEPPPVPSDAIIVASGAAPAGTTWEQPFWLWYDGAYTWIPGRYIPTLAGYAFHQPSWIERGGSWVFSGGVWTDAEGRIVASAPPTETGPAQGVTVGGFVEPRAASTYVPSTIVIADAPSPVREHRGRIDHTVRLGHLYYGTPRTTHADHDDATPAPRADSHVDHAPSYGYGYGTMITGRSPMYGASRVYGAPGPRASCPTPSVPSPPITVPTPHVAAPPPSMSIPQSGVSQPSHATGATRAPY